MEQNDGSDNGSTENTGSDGTAEPGAEGSDTDNPGDTESDSEIDGDTFIQDDVMLMSLDDDVALEDDDISTLDDTPVNAVTVGEINGLEEIKAAIDKLYGAIQDENHNDYNALNSNYTQYGASIRQICDAIGELGDDDYTELKTGQYLDKLDAIEQKCPVWVKRSGNYDKYFETDPSPTGNPTDTNTGYYYEIDKDEATVYIPYTEQAYDLVIPAYVFAYSYNERAQRFMPKTIYPVTAIVSSSSDFDVLKNTAEDADYNHLTSVKIPSTVREIGEYAFSNCRDLTEVSIPVRNDSLSIGEYAFYNCKSLKSIKDINNVTKISAYTFAYCGSLQEISIKGATTIEAGAFYGCTGLKTVHLSETSDISSIGLYNAENTPTNTPVGAFEGCTSLTEINLDKVSLIGYASFKGCTKLGENTGSDNDGTINLGNVKGIDEYAFDNCTYIKSVTAKNVEIIRHYAFSDCTNMASITVPEVQTLQGPVFKGCTSLNEIIADNATGIDNEAFKGCTGLTKVSIDAYRDTIPADMFAECTSLESLSAEKAKSIDQNALKKCNNLTTVDLSGLSSVPDSLFNGLDKLETVDVSGATSIGDNAFQGCSNLADLTTGDLTSIGDYAFSGCEKLTNVETQNVTAIGSYAFEGCKSLKDIELSESTRMIYEGTFKDCSSLSGKDGTIVLPEDVEKICEYAFSGCSSLLNVEFKGDSKITMIADEAFKNCDKLESIQFPYGLEAIGDSAFENCENLTKITIPITVDPNQMGNNVFLNCYLEEITCPCTYAKYGLFDGTGIEPYETEENGEYEYRFYQDHDTTQLNENTNGTGQTASASIASNTRSLVATGMADDTAVGNTSDLYSVADTGDSTAGGTDDVSTTFQTGGKFIMLHDWIWQNTSNSAVVVTMNCEGGHFNSSEQKGAMIGQLEIKLDDTPTDGMYKAIIKATEAVEGRYLKEGYNIPTNNDIVYVKGSGFADAKASSAKLDGVSSTEQFDPANPQYYYAYFTTHRGKSSSYGVANSDGNGNYTVDAYIKHFNFNGTHKWIWEEDPENDDSLITKNCAGGHFDDEAANGFIQCRMTIALDEEKHTDYYLAKENLDASNKTYDFRLPDLEYYKAAVDQDGRETGSRTKVQYMKEPGIYYATVTVTEDSTPGDITGSVDATTQCWTVPAGKGSQTATAMFEIDENGNIAKGHLWIWENTDQTNVLVANDCDKGHFAEYYKATGEPQCRLEIVLDKDNHVSGDPYTCYLDTAGTKEDNLKDLVLPQITYYQQGSHGIETPVDNMQGYGTFKAAITEKCGIQNRYAVEKPADGSVTAFAYYIILGDTVQEIPTETTPSGGGDDDPGNNPGDDPGDNSGNDPVESSGDDPGSTPGSDDKPQPVKQQETAKTTESTNNTETSKTPEAGKTTETENTTETEKTKETSKTTEIPKTTATTKSRETAGTAGTAKNNTGSDETKTIVASNGDAQTSKPTFEAVEASGELSETGDGEDNPSQVVAGVIKYISQGFDERGIIIIYDIVIFILVVFGVMTFIYKRLKDDDGEDDNKLNK